MKKNKIGTLAVASVVSLALLSGGIYAWFVSKQVSASVDVSTGEISIAELNILETKTNALPGETLILNENNPAKIENTGTRNAIVELSWEEENMKGKLAANANTNTEWADDWAAFAGSGDYDTAASPIEFKPSRIAEVIEGKFTEAEANGWILGTNGKYYTMIPVNDEAIIGEVGIEILGELGGLAMDPNTGVETPSRQFEQTSSFAVAYTAKAVQATEGAVIDYLGQEAADVASSMSWYD